MHYAKTWMIIDVSGSVPFDRVARLAPPVLSYKPDAHLSPTPYKPDAHLSPTPYKPDAHLSPTPYKPDAHLSAGHPLFLPTVPPPVALRETSTVSGSEKRQSIGYSRVEG
jgi:hypothetical protein